MKRLFLSAALSLATIAQALAWGQKGHDITAYIAECNLTPEAAQRVTSVLDGHSLVYYANWMDNIRGTEEYKHTSTWHYRNVDEGFTPETMPRNEAGDVESATVDIIAKLTKGGLSEKEEKDAVKMLIHLVGDLHTPMHAGRLSDLGGNRVKVQFFGRDYSLHSIWDTPMIDYAHKWSYTEWQYQLDRLSEACSSKITEGEPADWFAETYEFCTDIYKNSPKGAELSYDYLSKYTEGLENQLLKGGLRLAKVLNEIYK